MTSTSETETAPRARGMEERYRRAAAELPPVAARRTAGNAVDGYWLDEARYFYLAEALDTGMDRVIETPMLFDAGRGASEAVIQPERLLSLLAANGYEGRRADLADAQYDMPDAGRLAVTIAGRTWLVDPRAEAVITDVAAGAPAIHSPDGRFAVEIDGNDLALRDRQTGVARRLTALGAPDAPVGQHPQTGVSAVSYRRRPSPLGRWSMDSRWFLTHVIDERGLDELTLVQHAPPGGGGPIAHRFKAPLPYGPLPRVTLLAIEAATGRIVAASAMEMAVYAPILGRTAWFSGPDQVCYLRSDRHLRDYELVSQDLATGAERVLMRETVRDGYIDLHPLIGWQPNIHVLPETGEVIWWSERDGWGHLYLHDPATGAVKARITSGAWQVRDIVHVDAAARRVLFTACGHEAGGGYQNRRLCAVRLDGEGFEVLVADPGRDVAVRGEPNGGLGQERPFRPSFAPPCVSPGGRFVAVRRTDILTGNQTEIVDLASGRRTEIARNDPAFGAWETEPLQLDLLAADDTTPLRAALFRPSDFDPTRSYPLLDLFYPGPQLVLLSRAYNARITCLARAFAELGFVVLITDTRALPFRSRALHQCGYPETCEPQLTDQAAVIDQVCRGHPFVDRARVGVLGFSAGGIGTVQAMLDYPHVFAAGVAINGNYDPRNVIAVWPNKYVGPVSPETLDAQDVTRRAGRLQGKLMIVATDMDENVNIGNSFRLVDALARANKDFELLVVPNEGHVMMLTNAYTVRRCFDFLVRALTDEAPPREFDLRFEGHQIARMAKANGLDSLWT